MMSRSQKVLPWPAKRAARCRCHGWMCAMPAAILVLLGCFQSAIGRAPASRPAPATVPMPRIIRLVEGTPYYFNLMRSRLRSRRDAGSPDFICSLWTVKRIGKPSRNAKVDGIHDAVIRKAAAQYAHGSRVVQCGDYRSGLWAACATGDSRFIAFYDRNVVSTVLVATRTAGGKPPFGRDLPVWLSSGTKHAIHEWLNLPHLGTIVSSLPGRKGILSPRFWDTAVVSMHPCRINLIWPNLMSMRLRFGHWRRGQSIPWLVGYRASVVHTLHHLKIVTTMDFRTGRYAATLPIHLTANGLKKLGFKVVYLTANTPAPAAELLTPADAAKIKIMRRRFEKWAGVWSRLHPGKHPH